MSKLPNLTLVLALVLMNSWIGRTALAESAIPSAEVRTAYINAHYTKATHQVVMRDGIRLYTSIYSPKDDSSPRPMIIIRTPYGAWPHSEKLRTPNLGPSWHFVAANYIIVYQDARGRVMSEGDFEIMRPIKKLKSSNQDTDESTDAFDTIDWLVNNIEGHNGNVGMQGTSYAGFYATMSLVDSHPALKAVSPQAPMSDLFMGDDGHHFGALYLEHGFSYFGKIGRPREGLSSKRPKPFAFRSQDNYDYLLKLGPLKNIDAEFHQGTNRWWTNMMKHETYDEFWQARSVYHNLFNIKPAVLVVGGWFDAEDLLGTLETYKAIERQNPGIQNTLVMGPWTHGGWRKTGNSKLGVLDFGAATGEAFQAEMQIEFFNQHLVDGARKNNLAEAIVFETGANEWRYYDNWPLKDAKHRSFYLANNGAISQTKPQGTDEIYDEYISDPAKPVPYTQQIGQEVPETYMVADQRFSARRPDVLVYEGEVLTQDMTLSGPVSVDFYVSTSGTDSDWVIKLIDVYPDGNTVLLGGYQQLVRGEIFRGKFRNSFEHPEPFKPNQVTRIQFDMPDIQHRFKRGHKLMIQVQSSWFPLFDRNPQTFVQIYEANKADFKSATQRIYRSHDYASKISVRVISPD